MNIAEERRELCGTGFSRRYGKGAPDSSLRLERPVDATGLGIDRVDEAGVRTDEDLSVDQGWLIIG